MRISNQNIILYHEKILGGGLENRYNIFQGLYGT